VFVTDGVGVLVGVFDGDIDGVGVGVGGTTTQGKVPIVRQVANFIVTVSEPIVYVPSVL
jgi:hypothetical protein